MTEKTIEDQNDRLVAPVYLSISRTVVMSLLSSAGVGAVLILLGMGLYTDGGRRVLLAYLVAFAFVLSLSLGAIFFVLLQHLMRAGWGVLVRRPAEILSLNVITVALLFLPIGWSVLDGQGQLYPWAASSNHPETRSESQLVVPIAFVSQESTGPHEEPASVESTQYHSASGAELTQEEHEHLYVHQHLDELTRSKQDWLNPGFFLVRACLFFAAWIGIASFYFVRSRNQDRKGGVSDTRLMERWSGPATFVFAITLTYAAFDLLMSLDPHWYSTIFGVYYFAGCAVGGLSSLLLCVLLMERWGPGLRVLSDEHHRDLGRLLFAFVIFWCYIAFSQYMLLWYANMPETTRWFVVRGASMASGYSNSWGYLMVLLLLGHFVAPFFGFMSRHVKSSQSAMIFWTSWLLVMHYLDLYWLVMPEFGASFILGLPELGTMLFVVSVYLLGASVVAVRTSLIPINDPRLHASLAVTDAY